MIGQIAQVTMLAVADEEEVVRQSMLQMADRVMHIHEPFRSNLLELLTDMVARSEQAFGTPFSDQTGSLRD